MTTDPIDQEHRVRIADDTGATLFVNAGAGSGKTKALIDRIARLVLVDEIPLSQIAAVTFTERAGAELRDRLRNEFAKPDRDEHAAARRALDDLDAAAIGTLHSFAQRILTEYPIEAGLPPLVDVLDEVGSSVAFEERWAGIQSELLEDDAVARPLLVALGLGVTLPQLRSLTLSLGRDWDLIEDRILADDHHQRFWMPDLDGFNAAARAFMSLRQHCANENDTLRKHVDNFAGLLDRLNDTDDEAQRLQMLGDMRGISFKQGSDKAWNGMKSAVAGLGQQLANNAGQFVADALNRCLRILTTWLARRVLAEADHRRSDGRLEFHDLLVVARNMLRHNESVRRALHQDYQRLLLDEFQDTDPIQIEIAIRICAGAAGDAQRWQDVEVPPGRLFIVGDAKQSIYRFRRASISTYLEAGGHLGEPVELVTNFRTVQPVLDWVNGVFRELITYSKGGQPPYESLAGSRPDSGDGPAVTLVGADEHQDDPKADDLRTREAVDIAGAIRRALDAGWTVHDERTGRWRPVRPHDVAVLLPARTSLPYLERAFDRVGVPYRAEASTLVYQATEIRDLLMCARAVADPSDAHALVSALRTPLFGCGDDDLWRWRYNDGGVPRSFSIFADTDDSGGDDPVGRSITYLKCLHRRARWMTPSEVLGRLIADRRMMEVAGSGTRARDIWRRLRYVVDQARAWSEVSHGGLRAYLAWANHQGQEASRVAESILPETDVDAVRIMTIHAAKGLEFPVVALSGMTSQPNRQRGVALLWPSDGGYAVKIGRDIKTDDFEVTQPIDEQMDDLERRRLLYVGATRARDHLIVSVHRGGRKADSAARMIAEVPAAIVGVDKYTAEQVAESVPSAVEDVTPPAPYESWLEEITRARAATRVKVAQSASGLEGTDPEMALGEPTASEDDPATADIEAGQAKGLRNLELPPTNKGRYGSQIGRAVHGVLQVVELATGNGLDDAVAAECLAEGVTEFADLVRDLARSALDSDIVKRAAAREHWRETYVGTTTDAGTVLEGYVDLIFRDDDGALVVLDYKTDDVPAAAVHVRASRYGPQMQAYQNALSRATGLRVTTVLLFLHSATEVAVG